MVFGAIHILPTEPEAEKLFINTGQVRQVVLNFPLEMRIGMQELQFRVAHHSVDQGESHTDLTLLDLLTLPLRWR